jgi:hypothetical protein
MIRREQAGQGRSRRLSRPVGPTAPAVNMTSEVRGRTDTLEIGIDRWSTEADQIPNDPYGGSRISLRNVACR